ncbi:hypothetical protein TRAPUB_6902, partial [Trametes pubescens]
MSNPVHAGASKPVKRALRIPSPSSTLSDAPLDLSSSSNDERSFDTFSVFSDDSSAAAPKSERSSTLSTRENSFSGDGSSSYGGADQDMAPLMSSFAQIKLQSRSCSPDASDAPVVTIPQASDQPSVYTGMDDPSAPATVSAANVPATTKYAPAAPNSGTDVPAATATASSGAAKAPATVTTVAHPGMGDPSAAESAPATVSAANAPATTKHAPAAPNSGTDVPAATATASSGAAKAPATATVAISSNNAPAMVGSNAANRPATADVSDTLTIVSLDAGGTVHTEGNPVSATETDSNSKDVHAGVNIPASQRLQEMVTSLTRNRPTFSNTANTVKRRQDEVLQRTHALEKEMADLREVLSDALRAASARLVQTQQRMSKERQDMQQRHMSTAGSMQHLESTRSKAQRDLATLHAQHIAEKGLIDQMANEIAFLWDRQEDIGHRLKHMDDDDQAMQSLAERLNEVRAELDAEQEQCKLLADTPKEDRNFGSPLACGKPDRQQAEARKAKLSLLESKLHHLRVRVPRWARLTFSWAPKTSQDKVAPLVRSDQQNMEFESLRDWARDTLTLLQTELLPIGDRDADQRRLAQIRRLEQELQRLQRLEAHCWDRAKILERIPGFYLLPDQDTPIIIAPPPIVQSRRDMQPFLIATLVMVSALHALAHVALPYTTFLLATIKMIILGTIVMCRGSAEHRAILRQIPRDARTAIQQLHLEPNITLFAACPSCFHIYAADFSKWSAGYPSHCSHQETNKAACNEPLFEEDTRKARRKRKARGEPEDVPRLRRPYPFYSLKTWLAELVSIPGIEPLAEKGWEGSGGSDAGAWKDIMDAPAMRSFLGPDGRTRFSVQLNGELHLVFSMFVDWFNPYGNKQAGKSHSVGAIYLACLNLPPHIRYRPENIYLAGIIPGPHEPHLHQLNHLLRPLVDELLELWHRGIQVEHTATRASGRLIRAAVIPLVCDLPALRKTAGFAGHSSQHFCSFCPLPKDDICNLDRESWPQCRTWSEHLQIAKEWEAAATERRRHELFQAHGLRWSELLRLPYWDPTRFALLDAMHNLYLGELRHHCISVWGIKTAEGRTSERPAHGAIHSPDVQQATLTRLVAYARDGLESKLAGVRKDYLMAVAKFNSVAVLDPAGTRLAYAQALLRHIGLIPGGIDSLRIPPPLPFATNNFHVEHADKPDDEGLSESIFSRDVLEAVRRDISSVQLPSWLSKPPRNLGSATHGKLKADHWRTACTINMAITLPRLWGSPSATEEQRKALENFMHLIAAVDLATRRTMNAQRAEAYDSHMMSYLQGLRSLYNVGFVPNHHLSLHLQDILTQFGPTHAWWAFPFERYNGMFGKMNTNNRPAEMPGTFMRYFYIGAKLRWLMTSESWPQDEESQEMVRAFNTTFQDVTRKLGLAGMPSFAQDADRPEIDARSRGTEEKLSRSLYKALLQFINARSPDIQYDSSYEPQSSERPFLSTTALSVPQVTHRGVKYGTFEDARRNSFILFRQRGASIPIPGKINRILRHTRSCGDVFVTETFLLVEEYIPLIREHATFDPYRPFPDVNCWLYYNKTRPSQRLLRMEEVVSHFAAYVYTPDGIDEECIVVKSLDR